MRIFAYRDYHRRHYSLVASGQYERSLRLLEAIAGRDKISVLDVGCGSGAFLAEASDDYDCAGIELTEGAAAKANENSGVPVTLLEGALDADRRFDVIRLGHVLTATPEPEGMLRSLEPLLARRGMFLIETALERNPSLTFWSASTVKWIRRTLRTDEPGVWVPTLFWRSDQRALRRFFSERMEYETLHFEVFEDGWPVWTPADIPTTSSDRIRFGIARLAVGLASHRSPLAGRLGNKAVLVVQPNWAQPRPLSPAKSG